MAYEFAALARRVVELAPAHAECNFRQLRGFARAGLTTDDDNLVRRYGSADFIAPAGYGQRFGKLNEQRFELLGGRWQK